MTANESGGLRERKKVATRKALSEAALRLALANGMANVRVNDIADAAGVSPRTYNNYFSSAEAAVVAAITNHRAARVAAALRDRPADEPLAEGVVAVVAEYYATTPAEDTLQLLTSEPRLRAEYVGTATGLRTPLEEVIADRLGTHDTMLPGVLAAAVAAAVRVAFEHWVRPSGNPEAAAKGLVVVTSERPLGELLREALAAVAPALAAAEEAAAG